MTIPPTDFDVLVIGAGPGGYACAIRAAQKGLKTACVDGRKTLGGTCLNVGCIPSKALLNASHHYHAALSGKWAAFGVAVGGASLDLRALMAQKDDTVQSLAKGIDALFRKNKVTRLNGLASFDRSGKVMVEGRSLSAAAVVIATGSLPAQFNSLVADNEEGIVVDSTGALSFRAVPRHLVVVGGGVIGIELGSVWHRLGSKVVVLEYLPEILPGMDEDVRASMRKILTKQGLEIRTSARVQSIEKTKAGARVQLTSGSSSQILECDAVLVATGRRPNTDRLNLPDLGVATDERGFIVVNAENETAVKGIYAIGDVVAGPMLAHRAEDEGIALAERLAGTRRHVNHKIIPTVVYTEPEAAGVGYAESELKASGKKYKASVFPMLANSRAKANRDTDGFVKLIADPETDVVLGAHIVSSMAGTMIAQIAQAMEFGATSEDIAYTCHAHPTHSEAIKEAALAIGSAAIHI